MKRSFVFYLIIIKFGEIMPTCLDETINANDILNVDLMPSSLIDIENSYSQYKNGKTNQTKNNGALSSNGSWYEAFATMGFHRKMLNEYLCRNFVADKILTQIQAPSISKRVGKPFEKPEDDHPSASKRKSRAEFEGVKNDLLADPGSSNYRDWLTKTTTLEDIYKHYETNQKPNSRILDNSDVEYEGGEITGYAMPDPHLGMKDYPYGAYGPIITSGPHGHDIQESEKHEGGYDYTPHHVHYHHTEDKTSSGGLSLPDVFDVSLTALAFLSFGIFILQVIMCISMNKMPQFMQMMEGGGDTETEEIRFKRDISERQTSLNELSRRVLVSIETGLAADEDNGVCLRRTLCENNKYSRTLEDNQKFWVPVWGMGLSWLSSQLIHGRSSNTVMLESLRACALGLANADCANSYSTCDLKEMLKRNDAL